MKKCSSNGKKGTAISVSKKTQAARNQGGKADLPEVYSMRGLSLSCPWFPVLGRRWPLYSDDSGKIQFTENVNGGNAYKVIHA